MDGHSQHRGGFEQTDVDVFAVGKFAIAMVFVTILALLLLFGVFKYFQSQSGGEARSIEPTQTFPQPQLQKTPIQDLKAIRAAEDEVLSTYGWMDQSKGVVRIPVDKAMDLMVQRGFPVRAAQAPNADEVSVPTESGLGPKMQRPGGPLGESK